MRTAGWFLVIISIPVGLFIPFGLILGILFAVAGIVLILCSKPNEPVKIEKPRYLSADEMFPKRKK
jgi:hypothetical protein